jgi:hypothetical protein
MRLTPSLPQHPEDRAFASFLADQHLFTQKAEKQSLYRVSGGVLACQHFGIEFEAVSEDLALHFAQPFRDRLSAATAEPGNAEGRRFAESVMLMLMCGHHAEKRHMGTDAWYTAQDDLREAYRLAACFEENPVLHFYVAYLNEKANKLVETHWRRVEAIAASIENKTFRKP